MERPPAMRNRYLIRFGIVGFAVGPILLGLWLLAGKSDNFQTVFLILCPPSIMALGLDNAGTVSAVFGWLIICSFNALLYGVFGYVLAWMSEPASK